MAWTEQDKQAMAEANAKMQQEFLDAFAKMTPDQRAGVIALAGIISNNYAKAGYKQFSRFLVNSFKSGELMLMGTSAQQ